MQITVEKSKHGFLAFGQGTAFFAPTKLEAVQKLIEATESETEEQSKEFMNLSDVIGDLFAVFGDPQIHAHIMLNLQIKPKFAVSPDENDAMLRELEGRIKRCGIGLSAISAAVSDHITGKQKIIILQQI